MRLAAFQLAAEIGDLQRIDRLQETTGWRSRIEAQRGQPLRHLAVRKAEDRQLLLAERTDKLHCRALAVREHRLDLVDLTHLACVQLQLRKNVSLWQEKSDEVEVGRFRIFAITGIPTAPAVLAVPLVIQVQV